MPRFPEVSSSVEAMPAGVFSKVAHRIAAIKGERYPLHVGDTWPESFSVGNREGAFFDFTCWKYGVAMAA